MTNWDYDMYKQKASEYQRNAERERQAQEAAEQRRRQAQEKRERKDS